MMKLFVAGKDRSGDIGRRMTELAAGRSRSAAAPEILPERFSALSLAGSRTGKDYLDRLIRLLWLKSEADTLDFRIPRRPGWRGAVAAWLKQRLWRLLRYQHDRMFFQQNAVNAQAAAAAEFLWQELSRENESLRARVAELERRSGEGGGRP